MVIASDSPTSPAAERMRRHRQRRRNGLRCLVIELRATEIDALVRMQFLKPEARNDAGAIKRGYHDEQHQDARST